MSKERNSTKKNLKKEKLCSSAFDLFISKGINNTAIDDIVKNAGVAKGTFYLYFKDKYDIINKIILQKSRQIFSEAMDATEKSGISNFDDICIFFVEYLIEYFKENKLMLKFINKNFSWSLYKIAVSRLDEHDEVEEAVTFFIDKLAERGMSGKEAEITLFLIVELIGSVSYNCIINNEPTDIDSIKPILYKKILTMLT